MALNFSNMFEERKFADDGAVTLQKQFAKSDTIPTLTTIGEVVFWERGIGIYDDYDSSLDAGKWDKVENKTGETDEATVTERTNDIRLYGHRPSSGGATAYSWDISVATNDLPAVASINEVEFRVAATYTGATGPNDLQITIFGDLVVDSAASVGDRTYKATKKEDGDWNFFIDDVLQKSFTPSDNIVKVRSLRSGVQTAIRWVQLLFFEMNVDGGVYMLVRSTDKTLQIPLDPL